MNQASELQTWFSKIPTVFKSISAKSKGKRNALKRSYKAIAAIDHAKCTLQLLTLLRNPSSKPAELSAVFRTYEGVSTLPIVMSQRAAAMVLTLFTLQGVERINDDLATEQLVETYRDEVENYAQHCMSSLARSLQQFDRFSKLMRKQLLKCLTVIYDSMYLIDTKSLEGRVLTSHSACLRALRRMMGIPGVDDSIVDMADGSLVTLSAKVLTSSLYLDDEEAGQAIQTHIHELVYALSIDREDATEVQEHSAKRDYAVPTIVTYLEDLPNRDGGHPQIFLRVLGELEQWLSSASGEAGMPEDERILVFAVEDFVNRVKQLQCIDDETTEAATRLEALLSKHMH
jgi:hypothetical protein